jgi:sialate O-acetylesterase
MFISRDSGDARLAIDGDWKYLPVAEYRAGVFWVFGGKENEFQSRPRLPISFTGYSPTALFDGMISPLIPFAIRGVIWYQGESNTSNPALYKKTFPAMIADWRSAFRRGDFPFYFVQLAPFAYGAQTQSQYLREAQFQTLKVKNTGMAVTLDIGNPDNIHPAHKQEVGGRLAAWALAQTYGKKTVASGPLYRSMRATKGTIVLSFDWAKGGLVIREHKGENSFAIAGEDRIFRKAVIRIEDGGLVVSHPEIPNPVAVRYAWGNTEEGTLFNKEGLPASSFRTDNWPER